MSDYISKKALLEIVGKMPLDWEYGKAVSDIYDIIKEQQTIDEKEIISKAFERVVERLEEELQLSDAEKERCIRENPLQFDEAKGYSMGIYNAIEFVKEEGGLNDSTKSD